ncbi:hypothetical protein DFH09DRAFT_190008 [Mycena vulgaris]|nr:hypothetical protein DFH09DRAFT_190008 [Mycena vulgaris]
MGVATAGCVEPRRAACTARSVRGGECEGCIRTDSEDGGGGREGRSTALEIQLHVGVVRKRCGWWSILDPRWLERAHRRCFWRSSRCLGLAGIRLGMPARPRAPDRLTRRSDRHGSFNTCPYARTPHAPAPAVVEAYPSACPRRVLALPLPILRLRARLGSDYIDCSPPQWIPRRMGSSSLVIGSEADSDTWREWFAQGARVQHRQRGAMIQVKAARASRRRLQRDCGRVHRPCAVVAAAVIRLAQTADMGVGPDVPAVRWTFVSEDR